MQYLSTRHAQQSTGAAQAIVTGIAPDGGLYVPQSFPQISLEQIEAFSSLSYDACSAQIMGLYLPEFSSQELSAMTAEAYQNFDTPAVVPLHPLTSTQSVMELFHGPTLAFKDMALQMLPRLMSASMKKTGEKRTVLILVATSGDTGKAALEGFKDVPGTEIAVFFPQDGVSDVQKLQMVTQEGDNTFVCAVDGNFDDAQSGVKRLFGDPSLARKLEERGIRLSSANSINWGRLLPQIAYYFWAYAQELNAGRIERGQTVNFVVPTGNFGDILAGYYAKRMGLPVHKLICASNANNVLSDFFRTGVYNRNRPFFKTASPSMDILISSNLERLLFEATGRDDGAVRGFMESLAETGSYEVPAQVREALCQDFYADFCADSEASLAIWRTFHEHRYLMDPHTAVAQCVYERYAAITGDGTHTVVLSTASPFKFSANVFRAVEPSAKLAQDHFEVAEQLAAAAQCSIPKPVAMLRAKPIRHKASCTPSTMEDALLQAVSQWNQ